MIKENLQKKFIKKIKGMRILEENDQTSLYVIIGLALMLIVFIMIGIFLEKAEVRILSLKVFIDQTLA